MNDRKYLLFLFAGLILMFCTVEKVLSFQMISSPNEVGNPRSGEKWISAIEFEGNQHFTSQELLDTFNFDDDVAGRVNALFTRPYEPRSLEYHLQKDLRGFLNSRGYIKATVGSPQVIDEGNSVKLIIPLEEGALYRFGSLKISGAKAFKVEEIREFLGFKPGQIVDAPAVRIKIQEDLPKFYANKGFIDCLVDIENINFRPISKTTGEGVIDLEISIEEGTAFRIRQIKVVGNADNETVRGYFSLGDGEFFNQSKLDEGLANLNSSGWFSEVGFLSDVQFVKEEAPQDFVEAVSKSGTSYKIRLPNEPEIAPNADKIGEITINIRVNKRNPDRTYSLGSVKFVGNKTISDEDLKKALNLRENSVFEPKKFIENIRNFNKTEQCRPIVENDLDIEVGAKGRQDDEFSDKINLTIHIWELAKK